MNSLKVRECFRSCQGEGGQSGIPMVFVRFQGCNLACPACDSKFTWSNGGTEFTTKELVQQIMTVDKYHSKRVYLTGGEVLLQDVTDLVKILRRAGYKIAIATNGTLARPDWWKQVLWDVDFKCPSSGCNEFNWAWSTIGQNNQLKFIVANNSDLTFVERTLPKLSDLLSPAVVVSPMNPPGKDIDRNWLQVVWDFCIEHNVRFSLQYQKVVFGNRRGV